MRYILILILIFFTKNLANADTKPLLSNKILNSLLAGKIFTSADISDVKEGKQKLYFKIAGIHPRKCKKAFKKLSLYENFEQYLDIVTKSSYNDKDNRIFLKLESILLPFNMTLSFVIPRIKKEGHYSFFFDKGFLKGLVGTVNVEKKKNRCLILSEINWLGPKTKIPNIIFEFFLNSVGKITMEKLFRISRR